MEIVEKLFEIAPKMPSNLPKDPVLKEIERILLFIYETFPGIFCKIL